MMVERERDEGEAMAVNGPPQEEEKEEEEEAAAAAAGSAATGEKGEGERNDGERDDGEEHKEEGEEEEEAEEKKGKPELEEWSELRLAIAELSPISRRGGKKLCSSPPTLPFLGLSHLLLRLLDKIGPTMAVLRLDVQRNIERLQELYLQDPSKYSTLTAMVEKEADDGTVRKADSCARAILWLTRSMDFTVALLQRLEEEDEEEGSDQQSLAQLVEAAYMVSLKPWHGWISSAACKIALKLIPERAIFVSWLMGENQNSGLLKAEIEKLVQLLQPFLNDIHAMLAKFKLDRLKST